MIEYKMRDTTICPVCGHKRSDHVPSFDDPLQDKCNIHIEYMDHYCRCMYYKADFDEEMEWDIISLSSGSLGI